MGLDMYLYKKTHLGNYYYYKKPSPRVKIDVPGIQEERVSEITERVGYWRKANQIHAWFVKHVQDGKDDCKEYYVERDKLQELLNTVRIVLKASKLVKAKIQNGARMGKKGLEPIMEDGKKIKDSRIAETMLPTSEGFFFGSTDYDEYYYRDLKETEKILEGVLKEEESNADYYYHSSW